MKLDRAAAPPATAIWRTALRAIAAKPLKRSGETASLRSPQQESTGPILTEMKEQPIIHISNVAHPISGSSELREVSLLIILRYLSKFIIDLLLQGMIFLPSGPGPLPFVLVIGCGRFTAKYDIDKNALNGCLGFEKEGRSSRKAMRRNPP